MRTIIEIFGKKIGKNGVGGERRKHVPMRVEAGNPLLVRGSIQRVFGTRQCF